MSTYSLGGGYLFTLRGVFHIPLLVYVCTYFMFGHCGFFSMFLLSARIRFRQRIIKKHVFFSAQRVLWIVADFRRKTVNFGDKKTIRNKTS